MKHSRIAGTGSYLPEKILSNADLEKMIDTTDEWIFTRTGIRERHIVAENEFTSDLAVKRHFKLLKLLKYLLMILISLLSQRQRQIEHSQVRPV